MLPSPISGRPRRAGTAKRASSSASTAAASAVLPSSVCGTPRLAHRRPEPLADQPSPTGEKRQPDQQPKAGPPDVLVLVVVHEQRRVPTAPGPTSATTDQTTSTPPSTREMWPSTAKANSGSGEIAVQTAKRVGSSTRIGAISPPSPATPNDRNVTPPRNVPAAAPGNPFALAAIPAARFSVSKPGQRDREHERRDPQRQRDTEQSVDEHVGGEHDHAESYDQDDDTGSS